MFIVSITYTSKLDKVDKHIDDHVAYLNKQYSLGHFLFSGRKVPRTGGIIMSSVKSLDELNTIIKQDPFYKAKVASYGVTEFIPTKSATNLEFLLEEQA